MIGKTLAHYQITAEVGKGGMGEVYRATDTKLGRDVAIKVLPKELSGDPERTVRFQREARSLAMLQHPNVASIYGFEEVEGLRFLVMELVEGEDLSVRLQRGALQLDETLRIARQIADGLAAAHEKGIVHRDLKPANVMLTTDGEVKILDFGLARAWFGDSEDSTNIETSPTITAAMTQAGTILGTAAYMSPEQARGRNVDQRSDIWAFAVIVWEMLTGNKLFDGGTISDVLAAVLRVDPSMDDLPANTPHALRSVLQRCLRKDRQKRLHSIADVRILLEDVGEDGPAAQATSRSDPSLRALPWVVAALALVAVVWSQARPVPSATPPPTVRFSLELPDPIYSKTAGSITLSPDGSVVAVSTRSIGSSRTELWYREFADEEFQSIDGVSGPGLLTFSPDSKWLLFYSDGRIKRLRVADGTVVDVAGAASRYRAAWREDGTIIYTQSYASGLYRISESGGAPEQLTTPADGELGHWYAENIPGSRYILYTSYTTPIDSARIMALDTKTLESKVVMRGGSDPRYSETGHVLFLRGGQWLAAPFDGKRAEVTGAVVPVLVDIVRGGFDGFTALDIADNGTLVWIHESEYAVPSEVVRLRTNGQVEPLGLPLRRYGNPSLSPDGRRLAIRILDDPPDLWIQDLRRDTATRFTFGPTSEIGPVWTPDGKSIFYAVDRPQFVIYRQPASGGLPGEEVIHVDVDAVPNSVTPDGKSLLFHRTERETGEDIWSLPVDGGEPTLLVQTPYEEYGATVSPTGRWMAYHSDESGRREIYVRAFPDMSARVQVSSGGGGDVRWSPDSSALTYISPQGFMRVPVTEREGELDMGEPELLYTGVMTGDWTGPVYDTYPDGSGWIFTRIPEGEQLRSVHVETGWGQRVLGGLDQ